MTSSPSWAGRFGWSVLVFAAALGVSAAAAGLYGDWSAETLATAFFFLSVNPVTLAGLLLLGILGGFLRLGRLCLVALVIGIADAVVLAVMFKQHE